MSLTAPEPATSLPVGDELIELRPFVDEVWSVRWRGDVIGFVERGAAYTALVGANFPWAGYLGSFPHAADAIAAVLGTRAATR